LPSFYCRPDVGRAREGRKIPSLPKVSFYNLFMFSYHYVSGCPRKPKGPSGRWVPPPACPPVVPIHFPVGPVPFVQPAAHPPHRCWLCRRGWEGFLAEGPPPWDPPLMLSGHGGAGPPLGPHREALRSHAVPRLCPRLFSKGMELPLRLVWFVWGGGCVLAWDKVMWYGHGMVCYACLSAMHMSRAGYVGEGVCVCVCVCMCMRA